MNTTSELTVFKSGKEISPFSTEDCDDLIIPLSEGGAIPFIKINGKEFIMSEGEAKTSLGNSISGIIVGIGPISRKYYKKAYTGEVRAPDCASADGVMPDSSIENPECSKCDKCQYSAWGSKRGFTGDNAKACQEYIRVAICTHDSIDKADKQIYRLDIPSGSFKNLDSFNKKLKIYRLPLGAIVTKISFDPEVSYPKLIFDAIQVFSSERYDTWKHLKDSDQVKRMLTIQASVTIDSDLGEEEKEEIKKELPKKEEEKDTKVIEVNDMKELEKELDNLLEDE
jgi:hypothetical protein